MSKKRRLLNIVYTIDGIIFPMTQCFNQQSHPTISVITMVTIYDLQQVKVNEQRKKLLITE